MSYVLEKIIEEQTVQIKALTESHSQAQRELAQAQAQVRAVTDAATRRLREAVEMSESLADRIDVMVDGWKADVVAANDGRPGYAPDVSYIEAFRIQRVAEAKVGS